MEFRSYLGKCIDSEVLQVKKNIISPLSPTVGFKCEQKSDLRIEEPFNILTFLSSHSLAEAPTVKIKNPYGNMSSGGQIQSSHRAFSPVNTAVHCEEGSPSVTIRIKEQEMCSCYLARSMHPVQNTVWWGNLYPSWAPLINVLMLHVSKRRVAASSLFSYIRVCSWRYVLVYVCHITIFKMAEWYWILIQLKILWENSWN